MEGAFKGSLVGFLGSVIAPAGLGLGFLWLSRLFLLRRTATTVAHCSSKPTTLFVSNKCTLLNRKLSSTLRSLGYSFGTSRLESLEPLAASQCCLSLRQES